MSMEVTKGEISVMSLSVRRVATGIEVKAKSEVLGEFFASQNHPGYERTHKGLRLFGIRADNIHQTLNLDLSNALSNASTNAPCLWFLAADGLSSGITFVLQNVTSKAEITSFMRLAQERIKTFYSEFVRPLTYSFELRARETVGAIVSTETQ